MKRTLEVEGYGDEAWPASLASTARLRSSFGRSRARRIGPVPGIQGSKQTSQCNRVAPPSSRSKVRDPPEIAVSATFGPP